MYARAISSVLYGTNKILRGIDLSFDSNFSKSFFSFDGKFIPFQSYWSIKGLRLDILSGWFLTCLWFNAAIVAYWKQLSSLFLGYIVAFLFFNHFGESIYYDPVLFRLILWRW